MSELYRTRTYIAADFDNDLDAVEKLHEWNDNKNLNLSFSDAHDLQTSSDDSLYCSIKKSLKYRMDGSKKFVLIVGTNTNNITKGGCQYCGSYNSYAKYCARGNSVDYRSYIEYECDKAVEAGIEIIVLYKSVAVNKTRCPEILKNRGKHVPMYKYEDGKYYWDYTAVRDALCK